MPLLLKNLDKDNQIGDKPESGSEPIRFVIGLGLNDPVSSLNRESIGSGQAAAKIDHALGLGEADRRVKGVAVNRGPARRVGRRGGRAAPH